MFLSTLVGSLDEKSHRTIAYLVLKSQETEHCNRLVTHYTPAGLEMSLCCAEGGVTVDDELLWTRDNSFSILQVALIHPTTG